MAKNKYGLSRKTNVAIASIAGIGVVKDSLWAIVAISIITLIAITYQWLLDRKE